MAKDGNCLKKNNAKRNVISSSDHRFFLCPSSFPSSIFPSKDHERKESIKGAGKWNLEQISISPSLWEAVAGNQNIALIISFQQSQGIEKIDNLIWCVVLKDGAPLAADAPTMSKLCITWGDIENSDNVWKYHTPLNFGIIHFNLYKYALVLWRFAVYAATFPPWHRAMKGCFFRIGTTELFSGPGQWSTTSSFSSSVASIPRQGAAAAQAVVLGVGNSTISMIS